MTLTLTRLHMFQVYRPVKVPFCTRLLIIVIDHRSLLHAQDYETISKTWIRWKNYLSSEFDFFL